MAGSGFFDRAGSSAEQLFLWGVVAAVLNALAAPYMNALEQGALSRDPNTPLSPADAAVAVVRGHMSADDAAAEAQRQGIDARRFGIILAGARVHLSPADLAVMVVRHIIDQDQATEVAGLQGVPADDFRRLVQTAGEAPGPVDLAVALRRGLINEHGTGPDSTSFEQGIAETALRDKWADLVRELAVEEPSPIEPLEALLQGQLDDGTARRLYEQFGGNPDYFTWRFNSRGTAPTPSQGLELLNKGIITESGTGPDSTSYEQLFKEGPWRNKWLGPFLSLREYVVPPRTVTALLKNGSISTDQALTEFRKSGLTPEMAHAYIVDAENSDSSTDRALTAAQVINLYEQQLIGPAAATDALTATGYSTHNAAYLMALADMRRAIAATNSAVSKIQTLYVGHKIDKSTARESLTRLGVPPDQVSDVMDAWDIARNATVKLLTPAQIAGAFKLGVIDQAGAIAELTAQGYTPRDAWIFLSVEMKTVLPDEPPGLIAPPPPPSPLSPGG